MSLVFHTLTYPDGQRPVRGQVRVRPVTDVVLDGEQREVVQGPSSAQLIDGLYVLDLDVLPDGYYHLITHPDGETLTVVVPPGSPPHDDAHKVPGSVSDYGWWVQSIRADNPAVPPAVTVGVASVTASDDSIVVDNTDPRNPKLSAPGSTGGGAVASVFGRGDAVVAETGDYAAFYDALGAADDALVDAEDYADGLIATEQTARAGDITALAGLITTEAGTRASADTVNATAISNEVTRAQGVEALKADLVAGKVPTSQLPALAINEVFPVASQSAMLALTAQRGDIARRTDFTPNHLFLLTSDSPGTLADWLLIVSDPGAGVDTVNGQSGTVVLGAADVGADTAAARDSAIADQHATDVSLFQAGDPDLTALAGLDSTQPGVVASDGAGWIRKSYAAIKTALALVKADVGLGNVDNTADSAKPVSTAQAAADAAVQAFAIQRGNHTGTQAESTVTNLVSDLAAKAPLASPALTGNPTAPTQAGGDNSTKVATTAYADAAAAAATVGLLDFRGSYDASVNTFPAAGGSGTAAAVVKGDVWIASVGGTLGGTLVTAGDLIVALSDTPGQTTGNWDLVPHDGAYVTLTGNQTIAGTKTFSTSPVVPTPAAADNSTKAASTAYVDAADALAILKSIGTAKGDQIGFTGSGTPVRHPIGADGTVQMADSSQPDGWKWGAASGGVGVYGDGSDGTVTFDGSTTVLGIPPSSSTYTLTRDLYLAAGTINSGVSIITAGFRIFCAGTLTNNGTIKWNGASSANNNGAVGCNNSNASINAATSPAVGQNGASGTSGAGGSATAQSGQYSIGGAGGNGGAGSSGAAGSGSAITGAPPVGAGSIRHVPTAVLGNFVVSGSSGLTFKNVYGGGGGGAGGGDGTNLGGGGGGGGGVVVVIARVITGTGSIQARGGDGNTRVTGNVGGGGGGGGGVVIVVSSSVSAGAITGQTIDANGGARGTGVGTGSNGVVGSSGTVILIPN
jgi:hypothetical protein